MPLAPNITWTNSEVARRTTAMVAMRRRNAYMRIMIGRIRAIQEAAKASACGAWAATARKPSSGRGNLTRRGSLTILGSDFKENARLFENPILRSRAQPLQAFFAARLRIHPHHRLGPGKSITDPRSIAEDQLQAVGADDPAHFAAAKIPRIRPQL